MTMDAALEILQDVATLALRTATATPTQTLLYNPYSSSNITTSAAFATSSPSPNMPSSTPDPSFFEKYKTFIIGAAIGLPLQIVGGWFYMRRRKQKKAAAALEKENLEGRLKELEMGLGLKRGMGLGKGVPTEQQSGFAGGKMV